MNDNDPSVISAADMISQAFSEIDKKKAKDSSRLLTIWKSVVVNVDTYGERLAAHTQLVDLKNGILLVETDHPGWIQILQLYSKFIVTGLQRAVPDLDITSLAFRLKGSDASLCGTSYEDQMKVEREKLAKKLEEQDRQLEACEKERIKPPEKQVKLPPELQAKLDDLKKSMLTNSVK